MEKICGLIDKYGLCWTSDQGLEIPHIVYERKAADNETVISHNFVVKYCDLVAGGFIIGDNLDKSFYDFQKKYFSKYFFREDTDLKWNFYLLIIVDETESTDSNICQLEQDDKYLRKLVMTEEEFEVYIGHGRTTDNSGQVISGTDTYAEWQRELSMAGLDGILSNPYESAKVQNYIEKSVPIRLQGRPIRNWENTGKTNSKYLVKKIEALTLDGFRSHCLTDYKGIPFTNVNLISGCNGVGKSSICSAIEYALTGEILESKEENGKAKVKIRNREDAFVELDSSKLTRDKKVLDQLWYGTATMARNSSLNRNFHTFNYLGLEASGKYMQELDINELVKNVLFGIEVTEAELKMQRYGKAFSDKKKEYGRRLKEISEELGEIQVNSDMKGIPVEEIRSKFRKLGYKEETILKEQEAENFLSGCRKILLENNQYVDMLFLKCEKDETGTAIMNKMAELNKRRGRYRALIGHREQLNQNIHAVRQKADDRRLLLKKLYEKIRSAENLIQSGTEIGKSFFGKQDFLSLKSEYEKNCSIREELLQWQERWQDYLNSDLDESELNTKIETQKNSIVHLDHEMQQINKQIAYQKKQNENLDTVIQEILNLAEQYGTQNENAERCPVCGTDFGSREKLMNVIREQKEFRTIDESILQTLWNLKIQIEKDMEEQKETLKLLVEEREKALQKRIAIAELKAIIPIDETQSGLGIQKEINAYIEQMQDYLEQNVNRYGYAKKVIESDAFIGYSENQDWIIYLKKTMQNLESKMDDEEFLLKDNVAKEQELEQEYQKAMEEDVPFSNQEWEECQLKGNGFQALNRVWDIDYEIPVLDWITKYIEFREVIQYAEQIYDKQEALRIRRGQIEKLEEEKRIVEGRIQNCQKACDVIERQKHLEDVMKQFLIKNAKQIELFFKLLHRPKEFGKLNIDNGNIRFMRNRNGQLAESGQMSTGQRMALAFSVMITLHIGAANAPNFLMLDEPVANLDDMHVLNLIDLLRELAISGTQIIITTADSQMAKFLRRKFSFLKEEYSHFQLVRKGDANTLIDIIHYSPDNKGMDNIIHLS